MSRTARFRRIFGTAAVLILAVGAAAISGIMFSDLLKEKYATFESPDRRFRIEVWRDKQFLAVGPGQTGDSPGEVRLYNQAGDLLEEADVDMVQIVENVEWTDKTVFIKFVGEWNLPPDE